MCEEPAPPAVAPPLGGVHHFALCGTKSYGWPQASRRRSGRGAAGTVRLSSSLGWLFGARRLAARTSRC